MEKNFMTVEEVAEELKVSKSYAYKVVWELNAEMRELGYENQKLQSENNTLRQILDKAEGFMRELKINGRNLWDAFKERIADILPGKEEHLHRR